jgi:hypothetical protein
MRTNESSPGVPGPKCGQRHGLTTHDSLRQEMPGAPMPGPGVKATERQRAGQGRPKAALLNLYRWNN